LLTLLDGVAWQGRPIPGDRVAALLAALAGRPEGVTDGRLIDLIWSDDEPANPTKALQVLVSRVRTTLGPESVTRYDGGYRLGVPPDDVDALLLRRLSREAGAALEAGDAARSVDLAERATRLDVSEATADTGPLAELRLDAAHDRRRVGRVLGLALAAAGRDQDALAHLELAHAAAVHDVPVTAALLRSVAATAGPAAALERYEEYRADLADRLGVDPDPSLQRLHRALLAADSPVRDGVHFEPDTLVGREVDLDELRAAMRHSRLVSVVGPGGLGKTRVAHVLAREATQPRVYFVELVGVTSGDDVLAEVGAALGVRGSVTGRRTLTPAQLSDVRSRIAAELDTAPTLLVLDNCEHVLESVASLVALLLVTTRDLHVLTTSRAPLGLSAEQVVTLRQLAPDDASALFVQRARAARADVDLPADAVADVVARLDGLPLAIELAAARLRTMSVEEVRRRLGDLFELLRTRDRSAPERHRTLGAVIEWSWDLLDPGAQEAMARLSVFHDGFTRETAVAVLGAGGADLVETLAEQSLVTVGEVDGWTRFRMLETVREFAADRLNTAGLRRDAQSRQDAWSIDVVEREGSRLFGPDEIAAVGALGTEENNLTDVLRRALRDGDRELIAQLLACLGALWTITGNHPRVFAIADGAEAALADWDPPEELRSTAQIVVSWLVVHLSWMPHRSIDTLVASLARWGEPQRPWAKVVHMLFVDEGAPGESAAERVASLAEDGDTVTAQMALLWASLVSENTGDVALATRYAREGLEHRPLTPYLEASLHAQLAQLAMVLGEHARAAQHAEAAWPILVQLHADDDARAMRVGSAMLPLLEGDLARAERILDEITDDGREAVLGSQMILLAARAELELARGDVQAGLRLFDDAVASVAVDGLDFGGLSPWVLIAASGSLVARVRYGSTAADERRALEMRELLLTEGTDESSSFGQPFQDFPLTGVLLAAVGAWALRYGTAEQHADGVRLLVIAERWAYNRSFPVMAWSPLAELAEETCAGLLGEVSAEYADRPPADLVEEAKAVLDRVAPAVTSSG
jgi:predicted ATPase/DNA-binding SARP family transcriptional activator